MISKFPYWFSQYCRVLDSTALKPGLSRMYASDSPRTAVEYWQVDGRPWLRLT